MTAEEFVEEVGVIYESVGRPRLEGRFAALLLTRSEPLSLSDAARRLGTAKSALSKIANDMVARGDLKREGRYSTREHLYQLVDHSYIRDLRERTSASRRISELASLLAGDPTTTDSAVVQQLQTHAGIHGQTAMALGRILEPEERLHAEELRKHEESNWDAIPPGKDD